MAVRATQGGYTFRIDANASGFAFSGLQRLPRPEMAKYLVWESGLTYQVLNTTTGLIEHSGTNAYNAIKYAQSGAFSEIDKFLDLPTRSEDHILEIKDGFYVFGSGFTGFDIHETVDWRMGHNTVFFVPSRYSGYVFRLSNYLRHVVIRGGYIIESGTAAILEQSGRKWTGYLFQSSGTGGTTAANGVSFCSIKETYVRNPAVAFHFDVTADGWQTVNTVEDSHVFNPVRGFKFTADQSGFGGTHSRQYIHNIVVQTASGITRAGIDADGLAGRANEFHNVTLYDMGGSGVYSAHFGVSGVFTIILGNAVGQEDFYHSGRGLKMIDQFVGAYFSSGFQVGGAAHISGILYNRMIEVSGTGAEFYIQNSASGTGAAGAMAIRVVPVSGNRFSNVSFLDGAETERMLIQKTSTANNILSQQVLSGGVVLPFTVQMLSTANATTIEGVRVDTSGNLELNRSGGTIQFNSGNTATAALGVSGTFFSGINPTGFITARLGTQSIRIPYFTSG